MPWLTDGSADQDAIHDNVSGEINAVASKATPVSADVLLIEDSAASFAKKKITVGSLPSGGGGGGGKSYVTDPNLRPPDTAHANDVEFLSFANGSDPVVDAGMSWINQGSVTDDIQGGRLIVTVPAAKTDGAALVRAVPGSGDFNMTVRHQSWPTQQWHSFGLFICNDSTVGTFTNYRYGTRPVQSTAYIIQSMNSSWVGSNQFSETLNLMFSTAATRGYYERVVWDNAASTLAFQLTFNPTAGWRTMFTTGALASRPTFGGFMAHGESSASHVLYASADFVRFDWTPDFDPTTDD